jgi:hypothetical protein
MRPPLTIAVGSRTGKWTGRDLFPAVRFFRVRWFAHYRSLHFVVPRVWIRVQFAPFAGSFEQWNLSSEERAT